MEDISNPVPNELDLTPLNSSIEKVKEELKKIIVGQHEMLDLLLIALLADGHVLIEGVPGIAKTLTSKLIAKSIDTNYSRLQFTPDLMPSDVLGSSIYDGKTGSFEFKKGPIFSNIILIDEINRAPAKTQAALFEVMEERQITIDGNTHAMKDLFFIIATQNPIDMEGTYRLPEAQLDRFLFKIEITFPNIADEENILLNHHLRKNETILGDVKKVINSSDIITYRGLIKEIHCDTNIIKYIAQIVNKTREASAIYLGASPRASIAILQGAKANAAILGRSFVTPDDVKFIAPHVLNHRIVLSPEKEMEGETANQVIHKLIDKVEIPR